MAAQENLQRLMLEQQQAEAEAELQRQRLFQQQQQQAEAEAELQRQQFNQQQQRLPLEALPQCTGFVPEVPARFRASSIFD